jgi:exodeoxyribonuclease-3
VVCLQETKVVNEDFPLAPLKDAGYHCLIHGQKSYNGVAILSREPASDPVHRLPDDSPDAECRFLAATVGDIRILNIYAPNGKEVGSDKYAYKLEWYRRLRKYLDDSLDPGSEVLLCGDFNVAPEDRDVWDPEKWRGKVLFSEPEKEALNTILEWGFEDALRMHHSDGGIYTWWDYRFGAFHRGWGVRIDHFLLSAPLARRCTGVEIERDERKGPKPSDHAPVVAILD